MSNKHSRGPRCPMCPKHFATSEGLLDHQRMRGHFLEIRSEEDAARAKMQQYHQEKVGK